MRKRAFFWTLTLLATLLLAVAYVEYRRWTIEPLPLAEAKVIAVKPGTPLRLLAQQLEQQGVIAHARDLVLLARLRDYAGSIQAGEYRVEPGMTTAGLLEQMVKGAVILHSLTIIEGAMFRELLAAMHSHDALQHTLEQGAGEEIMNRLGKPGMAPEGWFLPETYRFPRGTSDLEFLRRAHQAMEQYLAAAWENRAADLPLASPYEALILASIVEKETAVPEERGAIAGVFVRRLQKGMRLQTDPTVIYGLGDAFDGNLRRGDLQADTPWNTYTRGGLPPTPIALPGRASIDAVVHPEPGDALYFVSKGDGSHHFSATLEEHNQAVRRFQLRRTD